MIATVSSNGTVMAFDPDFYLDDGDDFGMEDEEDDFGDDGEPHFGGLVLGTVAAYKRNIEDLNKAFKAKDKSKFKKNWGQLQDVWSKLNERQRKGLGSPREYLKSMVMAASSKLVPGRGGSWVMSNDPAQIKFIKDALNKSEDYILKGSKSTTEPYGRQGLDALPSSGFSDDEEDDFGDDEDDEDDFGDDEDEDEEELGAVVTGAVLAAVAAKGAIAAKAGLAASGAVAAGRAARGDGQGGRPLDRFRERMKARRAERQARRASADLALTTSGAPSSQADASRYLAGPPASTQANLAMTPPPAVPTAPASTEKSGLSTPAMIGIAAAAVALIGAGIYFTRKD